jgi:hypothetical protein
VGERDREMTFAAWCQKDPDRPGHAVRDGKARRLTRQDTPSEPILTGNTYRAGPLRTAQQQPHLGSRAHVVPPRDERQHNDRRQLAARRNHSIRR